MIHEKQSLKNSSPQVLSVAAILALTISTLLCVQGYLVHFPFNMDSLINVDQTMGLLEHGVLPDRGGIASTGGYNPPGISWLYIPGILTENVYLYQRIGAAICHILTMAGIYLLTLRASNTRTALWAMIFYGFSTTAIHFGSSLWPRAFPLFFVWMTLCLVYWRQSGNNWGLVGALIWYAAGCYVFLEMLPAVLGIALVYFTTRQPFRIWPLLVAFLAIVALWFPYLTREAKHDFIDLRQQLFQKKSYAETENDLNAYRDQLLTRNSTTKQLEHFQLAPEEKMSLPKKLFFRLYYFTNNLSGRFALNASSLSIVLYLLTACCACGWLMSNIPTKIKFLLRPLRFLIGGLLLLGGLLCNPWLAGIANGRTLEFEEQVKVIQVELTLLIAGGLILINPLSTKLLTRISALYSDPPTDATTSRVVRATIWQCFLPSLFCTAIAAIFVKYSWWLWGIECILLAFAVSYFPRRRGLSSRTTFVFEIFVAVVLFWNSTAFHKAADFWHNGISGTSPAEIQMLDRLGEQLKAKGRNSTAIGYRIYFNAYELINWKYDNLYRLGAAHDLYFLHRFGIQNETRRPEGFSENDEYRIVQLDGSKSKMHVFKMEDLDKYRLIDEQNGFQLWERIKPISEL